MAFFRQLFEARPFWKLKPAPELVATEGDSAVLAARAADDAFVIAYAPEGESVALSLGDIFQEGCRGYWFNPRQNSAQLIGSFDSIEERDFSPPTTGRNNDWILVLDNATHQLPRLGSSYQHLFPKSR
ncbi:MAG: putative collagen-binding domain-containing protein [Planctomycetota bacterium]